jgi:universal stress protein E
MDITPFKHIMVVLEYNDGNLAPLARAARLSKAFGSKLTVFISLHGMLNQKQSSGQPDNLSTVVHQLEQEIVQQLTQYDAHEALQEVILSWQLAPIKAIESIIAERDFDLILKSPYEQRDFKRLFRHGLDNYFISSCPIPVWMIKPRVWDDEIEVLACIDVADDGIENHRMNKQILSYTDHLCGVLDAQMHVVDCYYGEIGGMNIDFNNRRGFKHEVSVKQQHKEKLQLFINEYSLAENALHFAEGLPDDALPQEASLLNAELVVIGNNEDSNFFDRTFGDTAVALTKAMPCDILILRPVEKDR